MPNPERDPIYPGKVSFCRATSGPCLTCKLVSPIRDAQKMKILTFTTSATDRIQSVMFGTPIKCWNGIYVNITTSGTVAYMVYGL